MNDQDALTPVDNGQIGKVVRSDLIVIVSTTKVEVYCHNQKDFILCLLPFI